MAAGKATRAHMNMLRNYQVSELQRKIIGIFLSVVKIKRDSLSIPDGWTTDRKAATINLPNDVAPMAGSTMKVAVMCIQSVDDFYVHIPEISAQFNPSTLNGLKNEMNTPNMVKQYKPCTEKPSNKSHSIFSRFIHVYHIGLILQIYSIWYW